MTYKSTAIITREGKWFVARSLELGVTSQGKTVEDAKKNLEEALALYLEDMPARRRTLTKESPLVTSVEVGNG
ncbi:MAG: type II toxin-antitoxin system HicB family antitoxin [Candidatus Harrisonbacteria bacterium]|nr:type II toxin-antitoxin system HicB family antitoxin [Candidatus Harrisonbacteria bacterium]MBI2603944.1 type II toxin-antitoxin system HicB family antitoxin [Candidatus Harrisonbacteria bacterium]